MNRDRPRPSAWREAESRSVLFHWILCLTLLINGYFRLEPLWINLQFFIENDGLKRAVCSRFPHYVLHTLPENMGAARLIAAALIFVVSVFLCTLAARGCHIFLSRKLKRFGFKTETFLESGMLRPKEEDE